MSDLVDRNIVNQALTEYIEGLNECTDHIVPVSLLMGVQGIIRTIPNAEKRGEMSRLYAVDKDEWIPTSERVPRNEGIYLVTVHYHIEGMPPETKVARFYNGSWEFDDCRAVSLFGKVVAWMVMPDPYEGLNERSER